MTLNHSVPDAPNLHTVYTSQRGDSGREHFSNSTIFFFLWHIEPLPTLLPSLKQELCELRSDDTAVSSQEPGLYLQYSTLRNQVMTTDFHSEGKGAAYQTQRQHHPPRFYSLVVIFFLKQGNIFQGSVNHVCFTDISKLAGKQENFLSSCNRNT